MLSYSGLGFGGQPTARSASTTPTTTARRPSSSSTTSVAALAANDGTPSTTSARHDGHDGRDTGARPAGRHDRWLVRRQVQFAVAGIDPPRRRDRPDHHLERPVLLTGAEQHELHRTGVTYATPGHREGRLDLAVLRGRHRRRHPSTRRPTRAATSAARTSPTRPASPRRRWTRSATRPGHARPSRGTPASRRTSSDDPHPDAARARRERHIVQPAGGGRDLPGAAGAGHRGQDDLAVVGPQRRQAGAGRARPTGTREQSYRGPRSSPGSTATSKDEAGDTGPEFSYFRDWVGYTGIATPAYGTSATYPVSRPPSALPVRADTLVTKKSAVRAGIAVLREPAPAAPRTSYPRRRRRAKRTQPVPPSDTPGTFARGPPKPLRHQP